MATIYSCVAINDRVSPPALQELGDTGAKMLQMVDENGQTVSHFEPTISPKPGQSNMVLTTPIGSEGVTIYEGMEIWAGWKDADTGAWLGTGLNSPFGGRIKRQIGGVWGGEHLIKCDLVDYGINLDRVWVWGWPTPIDVAPPLGWPPGTPVSALLYGSHAGGAFADGLFPAHLAGLWEPVIDPVFDTLLFETFRPGNSRPDDVGQEGQFYWVKVGDALRLIINAVQLQWPEVKVGAWLQATPHGDRIDPALHFVNLNVAGDVGHTYAWNPSGTELGMIQPFSHERDWGQVAPQVTVVGNGGVPDEAGPVYATSIDAGGAAAYRNRHSRRGTWETVYVQTEIGTRAKAQQIADAIVPQTSGARGTIRFWSRTAESPGTWVTIRNNVENLDGPFLVQEVNQAANQNELVCGAVPLDPADILRAGTTEAFLLNQGGTLPLSGPTSRTGAPDAARSTRTPLVGGPMTALQNLIQPYYNDLPAVVTRATRAFRPLDTGYPDPSPPPPTQRVERHQDSLAQDRRWADRDNVGHPLHWGANFAAVGQVAKWIAPDPGRFVRAIRHPTTGSATYTKNGSAATIPFSFVRDDVILMTAGGTGYSDSDPLNVTLSEAPPVTDPYP